MQEQLSQMGIKTVMEILTFDQFLKKSRAGELTFWIGGWIYDYPDAENIFQLLYSQNAPGNNKTGFRSKEFDRLYLKLAELDSGNGEVEAIVRRLQDIVLEEFPWIPLYYVRSTVMVKDQVKNFRRSSFIRNHLKYIRKL